jgi:hypothetical protein
MIYLILQGHDELQEIDPVKHKGAAVFGHVICADPQCPAQADQLVAIGPSEKHCGDFIYVNERKNVREMRR